MPDDETKVTSIDAVLNEFVLPEDVKATLRIQLYAREDNMRDVLHLAAVQFGLFPQIVAEVLAEVGLGSPMSGDERELIRTNFQNLMIQLQRQALEGE
jgi:hypothetical protein